MDFRLLKNIHWLHIDSSPRNDLNKEIFDILTPMRTKISLFANPEMTTKKFFTRWANKIGNHF